MTEPLRHPLLARLLQDCGLPEIDSANADAFLAAPGDTVLLFTEDPQTYPESADVAVVLPELLQAFAGRLRAGLVARHSERELQRRFGFARWPALVFLRDGELVGTITGMRDWNEFVDKITSLLDSPTRREAAAHAALANRSTAAPEETR